jgi:hypothetical protein
VEDPVPIDCEAKAGAGDRDLDCVLYGWRELLEGEWKALRNETKRNETKRNETKRNETAAIKKRRPFVTPASENNDLSRQARDKDPRANGQKRARLFFLFRTSTASEERSATQLALSSVMPVSLRRAVTLHL